jgi:hypothetical protein
LCVDLRSASRLKPTDRTFRELKGIEPKGEEVQTNNKDGENPQDCYGATEQMNDNFSILPSAPFI